MRRIAFVAGAASLALTVMIVTTVLSGDHGAPSASGASARVGEPNATAAMPSPSAPDAEEESGPTMAAPAPTEVTPEGFTSSMTSVTSGGYDAGEDVFVRREPVIATAPPAYRVTTQLDAGFPFDAGSPGDAGLPGDAEPEDASPSPFPPSGEHDGAAPDGGSAAREPSPPPPPSPPSPWTPPSMSAGAGAFATEAPYWAASAFVSNPNAGAGPFMTEAPPWAASAFVSNPNAGAGPFTTERNIPAFGAWPLSYAVMAVGAPLLLEPPPVPPPPP